MGTRRSRAEWLEIIAAFRESGETAARFAARRGLKVSTLQWWTWRLAAEVRLVPVDVRRADVVAVAAPESASRDIVELVIGDAHLRFVAGTDARYVAQLVAALRDRC